MKSKITFLALLITCNALAQAPPQQKKNQLKAGISGTFLGSGDLYGFSGYGEFERRLSKRFAYTARLGTTVASESYLMLGDFEAYHNTHAFFLDQDVKVQILKIGAFSVHPHAGFSVRYSWESFNKGGVQYDPAQDVYISHLQPERENALALGYGFGLNFAIQLTDNFSLEMLNSFDGYTDGATVVMNGFLVGYRF